jgi:endonuclease YncB( thermonuclease family)
MALLRAAVVFLVFVFSLSAHGAGFAGRVVSVLDGDSIEVIRGGRTARIRVFGIDCPERGQPYGMRAKEFTSRFAFGITVTIIPKGADHYGRTIAEVLLPDGRSLGMELVRAGLAWWYRHYGPGDREMERLEREARRTKRGLWRDPRPIPPWGWRHSKNHESAMKN